MDPSNSDRLTAGYLERQMTYSDMAVGKGLTNSTGENNCFLNSAVQVLWHLDTFRRRFRTTEQHTCTSFPYSSREGDTCIFCALKVLFAQFEFSDFESLPPDPLRKAMASAFLKERRFQMRVMEDAAECFVRILSRLHYHLSFGVDEDNCSSDTCIAHQQFALKVVETATCLKCFSETSAVTSMQMILYVSTNALVSGRSIICHQGATPKAAQKEDFFGRLLKYVMFAGETKYCPVRSCRQQMCFSRTLTTCPDFVTIGLVWDSANQATDTIRNTLASISCSLKLSDMFDNSPPEVVSQPALSLVAMLCYYGKHYSAFLYRAKKNKWVSVDDTSIKDIGSDWKSVADKCAKGRYLPVLLVYGAHDTSSEDNPTDDIVSAARKPSDGQDGAKGGQPKGGLERSGAVRGWTSTSNPSGDRSGTTTTTAGQRKRSEQSKVADSASKITCSRHPSYVSAIKSTSSNTVVSGTSPDGLDKTHGGLHVTSDYRPARITADCSTLNTMHQRCGDASVPDVDGQKSLRSSLVSADDRSSFVEGCHHKEVGERDSNMDSGSRSAADLTKWIEDPADDDSAGQYIDPSLVANVLRCRQRMTVGSNMVPTAILQSEQRKKDVRSFGANNGSVGLSRHNTNEDLVEHRQTHIDCRLRIETSDIDHDSGISGDRNSASSTSSGHSVESSLTSLNSPVDFGAAGDRTSCSSSTMSCSSSLEHINCARRSEFPRIATQNPPITVRVIAEQFNGEDLSKVAVPQRNFGEPRSYLNIDDWCSQVLLDADALCVSSCDYEKSGNMNKALQNCERAVDLLRSAESTTGVSQDMLIRLRMKRNAVVLTSRRLQRLITDQFHSATPSSAPSEYVRPLERNCNRSASTHLTKEEVGEILVEEIERRRNQGNVSGVLRLSLNPPLQGLAIDRTVESQAHSKYKEMLRRQLKTFSAAIEMENCVGWANESPEYFEDWNILRKRPANGTALGPPKQPTRAFPDGETNACCVQGSTDSHRRFPHSASEDNIRYFTEQPNRQWSAQHLSGTLTAEYSRDRGAAVSNTSTGVISTNAVYRSSVPDLFPCNNGDSTMRKNDCRQKKTVTFSDNVEHRVSCDENNSVSINVIKKTYAAGGILKNTAYVSNHVIVKTSPFLRSANINYTDCDLGGPSADESETELDEVSPDGRLRCGLCRRQWADRVATLCVNCSAYMSKFQPTAL